MSFSYCYCYWMKGKLNRHCFRVVHVSTLPNAKTTFHRVKYKIMFILKFCTHVSLVLYKVVELCEDKVDTKILKSEATKQRRHIFVAGHQNNVTIKFTWCIFEFEKIIT